MIRHYVTLALFALIALGAVSEGDIPEKCLGVVGCLLDSKGMPIITTSDGKEWAVIHDEEQDVPFFLDKVAFNFTYDDPRQEPKPPGHIDGMEVNSQGQAFITTKDGDKWIVYMDEESQRPYFVREGTEVVTWDDPRKKKRPPPQQPDEEFDHGGVTWLAYSDVQTGNVYYVNAETRETQWEDPRPDEYDDGLDDVEPVIIPGRRLNVQQSKDEDIIEVPEDDIPVSPEYLMDPEEVSFNILDLIEEQDKERASSAEKDEDGRKAGTTASKEEL